MTKENLRFIGGLPPQAPWVGLRPPEYSLDLNLINRLGRGLPNWTPITSFRVRAAVFGPSGHQIPLFVSVRPSLACRESGLSLVLVFALTCDAKKPSVRNSVAGRPIFGDLRHYAASPATQRVSICDTLLTNNIHGPRLSFYIASKVAQIRK